MKKKYIYGNSQILAQHDVPDNNEPYFYLHDRLGSVRLVIDDTGTAQNSYTYNPFGEMFPTECEETVYNPFKFTGQFFDDEIGQYYLRARQYDPALMRFTSRDPVIGKRQEPMTLHKYLYCLNDPINRIDPSGKYSYGETTATTAGYASLAEMYFTAGTSALIQATEIAAALTMYYIVLDMAIDYVMEWNPVEKMRYDMGQEYKRNCEGTPPPFLPGGSGPWIAGGIATIMLTPYVLETIDLIFDVWEYYFPDEEDKITKDESNEGH